METLRIVGCATAGAVAYGIAHDMVTAHVCVEYFTVAHPPLVPSQSPVVLALGWGVIATWWAGAGLGLLLALAARAGPRPKRAARDLLRPMGLLLAVVAGASLVAGLLGHVVFGRGWLRLLPPFDVEIPAWKHARFGADVFAHAAAYLVGAVGGVVLALRTYFGRPRAGASA